MPRKGYRQTQEHKTRIGETRKKEWSSGFRKGGWKLSEETKERMREAHKGMKPYKLTEETKRRMSEAHKGKPSNTLGKHWKLSYETRKKMGESRKGEKAYNWIKDRSQLKKQQERNDSAYYEWRKNVWERDNWKCRINDENCEGKIKAHHILGWSLHPELRYEINNGITLCQFHHPYKRDEEQKLISTFQSLIEVR